MPVPLSPLLAITAYRIAQEARTNAARHAAARRITLDVRLETPGGTPGLRLAVDDDGIGLPVDFRAGRGLPGMRERAAALRGTVTWQGRVGGGTRIEAWLPLAEAADAAAR